VKAERQDHPASASFHVYIFGFAYLGKEHRFLLSWLKFGMSNKPRYTNHLCNNVSKYLSFNNGTYSAIFILTQMGDFDTLALSVSYP